MDLTWFQRGVKPRFQAYGPNCVTMSYTVWLNDKTKFKDLGSGQTPPYGHQTGHGVQPKFSIKIVRGIPIPFLINFIRI